MNKHQFIDKFVKTFMERWHANMSLFRPDIKEEYESGPPNVVRMIAMTEAETLWNFGVREVEHATETSETSSN